MYRVSVERFHAVIAGEIDSEAVLIRSDGSGIAGIGPLRHLRDEQPSGMKSDGGNGGRRTFPEYGDAFGTRLKDANQEFSASLGRGAGNPMGSQDAKRVAICAPAEQGNFARDFRGFAGERGHGGLVRVGLASVMLFGVVSPRFCSFPGFFQILCSTMCGPILLEAA